MKDIRVNGRLQRVFVLQENEKRIVYIPVKTLHRVDYDRLKKMEESKPANLPLLDFMSKQKLDNGRLALVQFDALIQVANVGENGDSTRLVKPDERLILAQLSKEENKDAGKKVQVEIIQVPVQVPVYAPQPATTTHQNLLGEQVPATTAPAPLTESKMQYRFINKHGKTQEWSGQGRMPDFLKELEESGGDIEQYRIG